MTKTQNEIVGRSALGIVGLALLFGGWKTLAKAYDISIENRAQIARDHPNAAQPVPRYKRRPAPMLLYLIGGVLVLAGAPTTAAAVLPTGTFAKLIGPPPYTTLGEHGEDTVRRILRGGRRW
ncbi:MAG TPA: hypothetical protein VEA69_23495 [Tepidisphaeraceae bacterium]|nr:hypothetical protein [Tepidisphaeraceae bacterium]